MIKFESNIANIKMPRNRRRKPPQLPFTLIRHISYFVDLRTQINIKLCCKKLYLLLLSIKPLYADYKKRDDGSHQIDIVGHHITKLDIENMVPTVSGFQVDTKDTINQIGLLFDKSIPTLNIGGISTTYDRYYAVPNFVASEFGDLTAISEDIYSKKDNFYIIVNDKPAPKIHICDYLYSSDDSSYSWDSSSWDSDWG